MSLGISTLLVAEKNESADINALIPQRSGAHTPFDICLKRVESAEHVQPHEIKSKKALEKNATAPELRRKTDVDPAPCPEQKTAHAPSVRKEPPRENVFEQKAIEKVSVTQESDAQEARVDEDEIDASLTEQLSSTTSNADDEILEEKQVRNHLQEQTQPQEAYVVASSVLPPLSTPRIDDFEVPEDNLSDPLQSRVEGQVPYTPDENVVQAPVFDERDRQTLSIERFDHDLASAEHVVSNPISFEISNPEENNVQAAYQQEAMPDLDWQDTQRITPEPGYTVSDGVEVQAQAQATLTWAENLQVVDAQASERQVSIQANERIFSTSLDIDEQERSTTLKQVEQSDVEIQKPVFENRGTSVVSRALKAYSQQQNQAADQTVQALPDSIDQSAEGGAKETLVLTTPEDEHVVAESELKSHGEANLLNAPLASLENVDAGRYAQNQLHVENSSQDIQMELMQGKQIGLDQLNRELVGQLHQGARRICVRVAPPNVGTLDIEVQIENRQVHLSMRGESADLQQHMQENMHDLARHLRAQGLELGDTQFSSASANHSDARRQDGFQERQGRSGGRTQTVARSGDLSPQMTQKNSSMIHVVL